MKKIHYYLKLFTSLLRFASRRAIAGLFLNSASKSGRSPLALFCSSVSSGRKATFGSFQLLRRRGGALDRTLLGTYPICITWRICTRRAGKLYKARSRLYRSQFLQLNSKYLLESSRRDLHNALLCTVFGIQIRKAGKKEPGQNSPRKGENEKRISSSSLPSTSAKGSCGEKITRLKIEYAYDNWSPFF